jgi:hypothetical protein
MQQKVLRDGTKPEQDDQDRCFSCGVARLRLVSTLSAVPRARSPRRGPSNLRRRASNSGTWVATRSRFRSLAGSTTLLVAGIVSACASTPVKPDCPRGTFTKEFAGGGSDKFEGKGSYAPKSTEVNADATYEGQAHTQWRCERICPDGTSLEYLVKPDGTETFKCNSIGNSAPPAPAMPPPASSPAPIAQKEWASRGVLSKDLITGDHHCSRHCRGEPTRTTYKIEIQVASGHRLKNPKLECIGGTCGGWHDNEKMRIDDDGKHVIATFDMWTRPQQWRLTVDHEELLDAADK